MKICIKCKKEKDENEFKIRSDSGKRRNECAECRNTLHKEYMKREGKHREYYLRNYSKIRKRNKSYYEKNKKRAQEWKRDWVANKKVEDPTYRLCCNLRRRVLSALHGKYKSKTAQKLIGCDWVEARRHIESLWKEGMSWENYGLHGWHIDHIKPVDSFDLSKEEEQKKCFHYTNLQPLWAEENLSKSNKI